MMRMNAKTLAFALLLFIGGSAAEKKNVKIDVTEDALFWSRQLQDADLSVAPTPPPVLPPTLAPTTPPLTLPPVLPPTLPTTTPPLTPPPVLPPTLPPTTPPPVLPPVLPPTAPPLPPLPSCSIAATVTCSVGEGIECSTYQAPADRCLQQTTYGYTFQNNGTAPLTITEAITTITGVEPINLLPRIMPTTLEAGQSATVFETVGVDFCARNVTNTVLARADPGGCVNEATFVFPPSRRRVLRGD